MPNPTTSNTAPAPTTKLNSGYEMPVLGLGTWTLDNETAENSVYTAIKVGYRLIDAAQYYGNEAGVGKAMKRAIDEGLIARKDIFITTKVMPSNYSRAYASIDESLAKLQTDYIDLLLIHQPGTNNRATYKALEQGVKDGKIRSIGISNYYTPNELNEVLSFATITPALVQNENHIFYQNTELLEYAAKDNIKIESWYPFGGRGHTEESFTNETIVALTEKYHKTPAQIILRWQIQAGYIVIPGSSNPDHIAENFDIFDFELTSTEMNDIAAINKNQRYENW
ncbi:aldo/keto reductase [Candidatus Saccharibacteria bacterium]|nr:aldo/keto reductase [Candidatus Saccharibacteria bacterium]